MRSTKRFGVESRAQRAGRVPLRTIKELAEEFGTSVCKLSYAMRADPSGPRARLNATGEVRGTWFNPAEVRAWWANRKEAAAKEPTPPNPAQPNSTQLNTPQKGSK